MNKRKLPLFLTLTFIVCLTISGCGSSQGATPAVDQGTPAKQDSAITPEVKKPAEPSASQTEPQPQASTAKPDEMSDRLAKAYTDMMEKDKYFMKYRTTIEIEGESAETLIEVAYDGDDYAMKTMTDGIESHMILKEKKLYMIDHVEKMVLIINSDDYDEDMDIETEGLTFISDGTKDFLGKSYPYEEYSVADGTINYFFEGKKLVGMIIDVEGLVQVLEILEMSENYPAGIFTIPADYEQQTLGQ